jgi:hypothetical protein
MPKKTVSLSNELRLATDAVGGVKRLVRHLLDSYGGDDPEVLAALDTVLVVVGERLRLLDRAVRGTIDRTSPGVPRAMPPPRPAIPPRRTFAWKPGPTASRPDIVDGNGSGPRNGFV